MSPLPIEHGPHSVERHLSTQFHQRAMTFSCLLDPSGQHYCQHLLDRLVSWMRGNPALTILCISQVRPDKLLFLILYSPVSDLATATIKDLVRVLRVRVLRVRVLRVRVLRVRVTTPIGEPREKNTTGNGFGSVVNVAMDQALLMAIAKLALSGTVVTHAAQTAS